LAIAEKDAQMRVEIEVRNVMFIAGRGTVVVGHVLSGAACVGQTTAPLQLGGATERRLEVSAVERLSSMEARGQGVGIVFRDPPGLNDLKRALPPGSILVLEKPGDSGPGVG
jgi:translation elongation factor EF-Tu-like GTPase